MSTLTCELLGTTTIFASKILRKSSQKRSLNLSPFWLLFWTPFSGSLAARSRLFDDPKSRKSLPYPTWAAQDPAQRSQDALMMFQERAKEALGSPRRHFGSDFGLNFGANWPDFQLQDISMPSKLAFHCQQLTGLVALPTNTFLSGTLSFMICINWVKRRNRMHSFDWIN